MLSREKYSDAPFFIFSPHFSLFFTLALFLFVPQKLSKIVGFGRSIY